jgi:hypothetical protein
MNFMQSDPRIYNTMKYAGQGQKWKEADVYGRLSQVQALGFKWEPITGKLKNMGDRYIKSETPWIHNGPDAFKMCGKDHGVVFNGFGFIPEGCMRCWKVCLGVKDFHNTRKLNDYQQTCGMSCKCGMELRDYTPKHWGGYFYNNSFDEGMDCYEKVKKDLDDHLGEENYQVILKRGCTEMEFIVGPSPLWHITDQQRDIYQMIDNFVVVESSRLPQNDIVKNNVNMKWMLWAHANGDMSYKEYNGGESLFPAYVSYEDRNREEVKSELAAAQALAKGIPPAQSMEFLGLVAEYANKNMLDVNTLGQTFGYFGTNPNPFTAQMIEEIPAEVKGEHEEQE